MIAGFTVAPADERTLTAGAYLIGAVELAAMVGALAYAAWRVRATLLPGWSGAPGRLAEAILAIAAAIWLAEGLGTFGLFTEAAVLAGSLTLAVAATVVCPRIEAGRPPGRGG
jgi:hypothetical protein